MGLKLTPGNPAINEKYFKQQGLAKKITEALLNEYDIGWADEDEFGYSDFTHALEGQIEATVESVIDENL